MKTVYLIGDSHVGMFLGERNHTLEPMVRTFGDITTIDMAHGEMAGTTIYGLLNPQPEINTPEKIQRMILSEKRENVVMVLGEVDVRWHIRVHHGNRTVEEAVQEVVDRYESFIKDKVVPMITGKIVLFGGIPYTKEFADQTAAGLDPPFYVYVKTLDKKIKEMARKNGYGFISVLEEVAPDEMYALPEMLQDPVHLDCAKIAPIVIEKLKKELE